MRLTLRWGSLALLAAVVLHAGLWTLRANQLWDSYGRLWHGAAGAWTDEGARVEGWVRPRLVVQGPALAVTLGPASLSWSAAAAVLTPTPSGVALESAAPQPITWGGAVVATTDRLAVSGASQWSGTNLALKALPTVSAATWGVSWDGVVLSATVADIAAPGAGPLAHLSGRAVLSGPAHAWRLEDWAARWGALAVAGSATLVWDGQAPALAGMVSVAGYQSGLDGLAAGVATPGAMQAMRGVLDTLAAASPPGPVTVPVALRDGVLTVAGFPLFRLHPAR